MEDIYSSISNGDILEVNKLIASNNDGILSTKKSLCIVMAICRLVAKPMSNEVSPKDIFELIQFCCKNIRDMQEKEKSNFIISMYHIIHYLFKQKEENNAIHLTKLVKKYCIDENHEDKMYCYYFVMLYNNVFINAKSFEIDTLIHTILFSIEAELLIPDNDVSSILENVKIFPLLFRYSGRSHVDLNKFCVNFLMILDKVGKKLNNEENILKFYRILLNVMHVTVANLNIFDENYQSFILNNLDAIFETMNKYCNKRIYSKCVAVLSTIVKYFMRKINEFTENDLKRFISYSKELRQIIREYGYKTPLILTCTYISKTFKVLFEHFLKHKETFVKHFTPNMQLEMFRLLQELINYLTKNDEHIESGCTDCKLKTDIHQITSVASYCSDIMLVNLRVNVSIPEFSHYIMLMILENACNNIKKIKDQNCEKYVTLWQVLGPSIYNTAVVLLRNKDYELSKKYSELFISNLMIIEGLTNKDICFKESVGASFYLHGNICFHLKENYESLKYYTLTMLYSEEYQSKALNSWMVLKSTLNDEENEFKTLTVNQILSNEAAIKEICPSYEYSQEDTERLLNLEVNNYLNFWCSKACLKSCLLEMYKVTENVMKRTSFFVKTWEKIIQITDKTVISLLEESVNSLKDNKDTNNILCLSLLSYILYQFKLKEMMIINSEHMDEANIPLKNYLQPHEEFANVHDKCDIVPVFNYMKIDNMLKLYELLDDSLRIWSDLLENKKLKIEPTQLIDLNVSKFIKLTAYEYRLQHNHSKMINAWILYLKIGKLLNDNTIIVSATGFILEYSDCKSEKILQLERIAEKLLKTFNKKDWIQFEIFITYYINKCTGYFKSNQIEKAYEIFCSLSSEFIDPDDETLKICNARLTHLKTCFLLIPCKNQLMDHNENILWSAQKAFALIAQYFKEVIVKCAYMCSILFEISLANGWIYKLMRLPREVRCYTKESIILTQRLLIPIRTAQFLSLLSFTDLLNANYLDCEVKLTGLMKILSYGSNYYTNESNIKKVKNVVQNVPKLQETNYDSNFPTFLDVPIQKTASSNSSGSPTLRKSSFFVPDFIAHHLECDCFMCTNFEYQKLVLDVIHLEAIFHKYQDITAKMSEYFAGGLQTYKMLMNKKRVISYPENLTSSYFPRLNRNLYDNYSVFLLDYYYYLMKKSDINEATTLIEKIISLVNPVKTIRVFFWNELMLQKTTLKMYNELSHLLESPLEKTKNLQVSTNSIILTPENKISQTKVPISTNTKSNLIKIKPTRKIKFDLSDSEDESSTNNVKTPEENISYLKLFQTPAKTPLPVQKTKIYTPKTVHRKKVETKSSTITKKENIEENVQTKSTLNKQLENHTKLLTQKLKTERKFTLKDYNNIDKSNNLKKTVKIEKQKTVKKIPDLDEITKSVNKLSLKSTKKFEILTEKKSNKLFSSDSSQDETFINKTTRISTKTNATSSTSSHTLKNINIQESNKNLMKNLLEVTESVNKLTLNASENLKNNTRANKIKDSPDNKQTGNLTNKTLKKKKTYHRIKKYSSSSTSSGTPENVAPRKSRRIKKTTT